MSLLSRVLRVAVFVGVAATLCFAGSPLKVCAEPANLPFSNVRHEGFENQMAQWIAQDLGRKVEFVWWPQRVRFVEKRLKAGQCDLVIGVPAQYGLMSASIPYYRSSYVFVSRRDRHLNLHTLHDESLKTMRIGLHVIGDEMESVPPARLLVAYGMSKNIVGYSIYGRPLAENAPSELIRAVASGDIDVAVAWGPTAGFFASRSSVPLQVSPICQETKKTFWPMQFDISIGVRHGDKALLKEVNRFLSKRKPKIQSLLRSYHVPVANASGQMEGCE